MPDFFSSGIFREMLIMFGLMLLLLHTVSCVDRMCRFNQTEPCYAALGHKLSLQMVLDPHDYSLNLHKNISMASSSACEIKNDEIRVRRCELFKNRSDVMISNGTVIIKPVTRTDSGKYTLKLYDSDDREISKDLQVNVEAPIGSVQVSISCISGDMQVFCSSEGDEPIFNWTLNENPLNESSNTIYLNEKTSGNITCSVKNHINHDKKSITLYCTETTTASMTSDLTSTLTNSTQRSVSGNGTILSGSNLTCTQSCGEFSSWKFAAVSLVVLACVSVILIVLVITVYHIYKRKKHHKSTAAAERATELVYAQVNPGKLDSNKKQKKQKKPEMSRVEDVEYAAVSHQTKRKEKKKMKEEELQYGELTFTPAVSNIQRNTKEEECVYSQIYTQKHI